MNRDPHHRFAFPSDRVAPHGARAGHAHDGVSGATLPSAPLMRHPTRRITPNTRSLAGNELSRLLFRDKDGNGMKGAFVDDVFGQSSCTGREPAARSRRPVPRIFTDPVHRDRPRRTGDPIISSREGEAWNRSRRSRGLFTRTLTRDNAGQGRPSCGEG